MLKKYITVILIAMLIITSSSCKNEEVDLSGKLTIYGLEPDHKILTFIYDYKEYNPGANIIIKSGINDTNYKVNEAIKKLNTELLAGGGPDVIIMDDINVEKYSELGLLEDISDIVKESEGIPETLIDSNSKQGKIFSMPASIALLVTSERKGTDADFSSLEKYIESVKKNNLTTSFSYENLISLFYRTEISPVFNEGRNIEYEELKQFYVSLKELKNITIGGFDRASLFYVNTFINPLNNYEGIALGRKNITDNETMYFDAAFDYITNISYLQDLYFYKNQDILDFEYCKKDDGYIYLPMLQLAVNANSKNKELAKDFIKYAFSEEGQQNVRYCPLIPVNMDLISTELELNEENMVNDRVIDPMESGNISEIGTVFSDFGKPLVADGNIMEIIMDGAMSYLNGENDLDTVMNNTMNRLNIYLTE